MLPSNMLLPNLILLIDVTFSTPTPDFDSYARALLQMQQWCQIKLEATRCDASSQHRARLVYIAHCGPPWKLPPIGEKSRLHSEPPESKFISEALSDKLRAFLFFSPRLGSCLVLVDCHTGPNATKRVQSWADPSY